MSDPLHEPSTLAVSRVDSVDSVPKQFLPRSTVLIELPQRMRSQVQRPREFAESTRWSPAVWLRAWREAAPAASSGRDAFAVAHAFTYTEPGGSVELSTEELLPSPRTGLIRDAYLTTVLHESGPSLYRLRLLVHAELSRELRFSMPGEATLVRVQLDGSDAPPRLTRASSYSPCPPDLQVHG